MIATMTFLAIFSILPWLWPIFWGKVNFHQNLGSKVNYVYLSEFGCEFHSEYIKTTEICITLRSEKIFFHSLSVSGCFLILVKFVFFCQIFLSEGHFWNFEMMGNRQSQTKILKNCRKNHVLRIYILKYVLNEKWMWFLLLKFGEFA